MLFEWDQEKNRINERKHLIRFEEAQTIFDGPVLTIDDDRRAYGEARQVSYGVMALPIGGVVIAVVHTRRGKALRIISARKANRKERKIYYARVYGRST